MAVRTETITHSLLSLSLKLGNLINIIIILYIDDCFIVMEILTA